MNAIKFEKEMDRDGDGIISAEEVQVADQHEKNTIQSRITIASFVVMVLFLIVHPQSYYIHLEHIISSYQIYY